MPAMYYRWHYNNDFAIAEFGRNNDPGFSHEEQLRIGAKVAQRLRSGAREAQPLERLQSPPASLVPVLRLLCRDFVPILVTEIAGVQRWLAEQPGDEELPRYCGTQRVRLGRDTAHEIELPRALFPYNQWMLQRLQDAWQRVSDSEQTSVRATLRGLGAEALLDIPITTRVLRREFRLWRAA